MSEATKKQELELMPVDERQPGQESMPVDYTQDTSPLGQIMAASRDPSVDLDRVDRMLKIYREEEAIRAEREFSSALSECQSELQNVVVNKKNAHTKSKYADLAAVHSLGKPVWTSYGFSISTNTKPTEQAGQILVVMTVRHKSGHTVLIEDFWPLDIAGAQGTTNKTAIQAKASSVTYARRYSECMFFDIAIDNDKDGNGPDENELSTKAGDWIAKVNESSTMAELEKSFKEGYKDLGGDSFGRNQLIKAKDSTKNSLKERK